MPVFRPGLQGRNCVILKRKQKNSSNPFRIRIFLFLSSYTPLVPSKTIPVFRPKQRKTLSDGAAHTYYSLYKGVPPPGGVNMYS